MTKNLSICSINPVHEVTDAKKLALITESIQRDGWTGRDLVVYPCGDGYQAMTGSHRYAAACAEGLEQIPCVVVPAELFEAAGYESDMYGVYCGHYDDDDKVKLLQEIGADADAIELMQQEAKNNH